MVLSSTRPMFNTKTERQASIERTYENEVNYKLRIFETIFPAKCLNVTPDTVIDKVLKNVNHIYEELTKIED